MVFHLPLPILSDDGSAHIVPLLSRSTSIPHCNTKAQDDQEEPQTPDELSLLPDAGDGLSDPSISGKNI